MLFFRKKKWVSFREAQQRALQKLRLLSNQDDCLENTKNLWANNTDMFGMIKR